VFGGRASAKRSAGFVRRRQSFLAVFAGLMEQARDGFSLKILAKGFEVHAPLCRKSTRLVNSPQDARNHRRGREPRSDAKLQRQLERLSRLPKAKQKFVSEMLDTVLQQAGS
jgi:hypothetical protein